jgi:hypothetical protein
MDNLIGLSLWGSPQEDIIDFEEELAQQRARRRAKGFRPHFPQRFSNIDEASMLEFVAGGQLILSYFNITYSHDLV